MRREIRQYLEMNENKNILRRSQINHLIIHLKEVGKNKKGQTKPKTSRKKESQSGNKL